MLSARALQQRRGVTALGAVCLIAWSASACAPHLQPATSPSVKKVLKIQKAVAPLPRAGAGTLETWDRGLAAALAALAVSPTAEAYRRVAVEYRRLGVLDHAHAYFTRATELDPDNASAFDARARLWRDWGFPVEGMADARRAVELAPASAAAANTLGTLLEAQGKLDEARVWYERALTIDPHATYALNNLCYSAIMLGSTDAVSQCRTSLRAEPGSRVARNNLGLALAAAGRINEAKALFDLHADLAYAQYNMGIVYMSMRQFDRALAAFVAAMRLNPQFEPAVARARQAGLYAAEDRHRDDN